MMVAQVRHTEYVARPDPGGQQSPHQNGRREAASRHQKILFLLKPFDKTESEHEEKRKVEQDGNQIRQGRLLLSRTLRKTR